MNLRPYQSRAIKELYAYMEYYSGNPVCVLPTGSGKSVVIAHLCKDAISNWPETRILMMAGRKELIEQNHEKLIKVWPSAPVGIYSAAIGRRELGEHITIAGIQSVRSRAKEIGFIDLVIVDEADEINHEDTGAYRALLKQLADINPNIRIIGFTATPYRLGHGYITDKPAIFSDILEPVRIPELIKDDFLCRLSTKSTKVSFDISGVHIRGGEYVEEELQAAVDKVETNEALVKEVIARAGDRKSWLVFATGINHAQHLAELFRAHGITAECVTGDTPKAERERMLREYKIGKIQCLTNANVLTVGFDAPNTDLLVFARPTESPRLYMQMAGRGFRPKTHTDHCLVLDFAGLVRRHGPVTAVRVQSKKDRKKGDEQPAPMKECPECQEIIPISTMTCPACGYLFHGDPKEFALRNDDIMGEKDTSTEDDVWSWSWHKQNSKSSGIEMLVCEYFVNSFGQGIKEYFCINHPGAAGRKAQAKLAELMTKAGIPHDASEIYQLESGKRPSKIKYIKEGNFYKIIDREWPEYIPSTDTIPF